MPLLKLTTPSSNLKSFSINNYPSQDYKLPAIGSPFSPPTPTINSLETSINLNPSHNRNKSTTSPIIKNLNLVPTSNPHYKWTPFKDKISTILQNKVYSHNKLNNSTSLESPIKSKIIKDFLKFTHSTITTLDSNPNSPLIKLHSIKAFKLMFTWQKLVTQLYFLMETLFINSKTKHKNKNKQTKKILHG